MKCPPSIMQHIQILNCLYEINTCCQIPKYSTILLSGTISSKCLLKKLLQTYANQSPFQLLTFNWFSRRFDCNQKPSWINVVLRENPTDKTKPTLPSTIMLLMFSALLFAHSVYSACHTVVCKSSVV